VGNITCGGTGKTPVVEMLARELLLRGRRPAILSRGYRGGAERMGDEARVFARNLPGVPHLRDPDRVRAARAAVSGGADVLVLDDGFQHVRLARDLDLVLIDALDPFGGGRVLPAGLLREPLEALGGATLLGITRGALVTPAHRGVLATILRERCPGTPQVEIDLEPLGWQPLSGGEPLPPAALSGKRVAAFAGLGNPRAFRLQLEAMGLEVAVWLPFPDHHAYRPRDLAEVERRARAAGVEAVVTTQKDAVKIPPGAAGESWRFLRIACRAGKGAGELARALDSILGSRGTEAAA
jgi:tetraacyldisaccharide 4'-kinase